MEDTLGVVRKIDTITMEVTVLILVLMEDTLGDTCKNYEGEVLGLNPCFNGRYSRR